MLVALNLFSLLATLRLNHLSCYMNLFEATKSFMWFTTQPIRHRSLVFTTDSKQLAKVLKGEFQGKQELVDIRNRLGDTLLLAACKGNNAECVAQLVDAKASTEVKDVNGDTPLLIACKENNTQIVAKLVDAKASTEVKDANGDTPLLIACKANNPECVAKLVDAKASTEVKDAKGNTPLLIACKENNTQMVTKLIEAKSSTEAQDSVGDTPLHIVCKANKPVLVRMLVEAEASTEATNSDNETPCEVAMNNNFMACAALVASEAGLQKYDAKLGIKHLIENPVLAPKLLQWARAEWEEKVEAERRVVEGVREGFLIPGEELGEEEAAVREAAEVWNGQHPETCK